MTEAVVSRFQAMTAELAEGTERTVLAIWAHAEIGSTDMAEATAAITAVIARANAAGFLLGDAAISAQIEALTATPTAVSGVMRSDDTVRLGDALATIVGGDGDTAMQLARLARAEPLSAAQDGSAVALDQHPAVIGWVRQTNAGACELCQWLARGGRIWNTTTAFDRHPGCNCQIQVVTKENDDPRRRHRRRTRGGHHHSGGRWRR